MSCSTLIVLAVLNIVPDPFLGWPKELLANWALYFSRQMSRLVARDKMPTSGPLFWIVRPRRTDSFWRYMRSCLSRKKSMWYQVSWVI